MPITQLMQKLQDRRSSRVQQRNGSTSGLNTRRSDNDPMECCTSFEVVAEVLPLSPGSRAGSMCSASSNAGSEGHATADDMPQQASALAPRPSTSSAALLASSLSGPLASIGVKPATDRALRARGKAMLRTEAGLPCINMSSSIDLGMHRQLSLESSSSMTDAPLSAANTASPRYMRSSTAPLPGSLRAVAPLQDNAFHLGKFSKARGIPSAVLDAAESEDGEEDLVHPISPAAAAAVEEGPEHCHWEDGVIASWLQGIDHSELLHSGDEDEDGVEPQAQPAAAAGASSSKAAAAAASGPPMSRSMPNTVFSSLLYN